MQEGRAEDPAAAREVCLRLLTSRPRSHAELETALRRRGFTMETTTQVLDRLGATGLLDDAAFAELHVRSGHQHRGLARRGLAAELRQKGVDNDIVQDAVAEIDPADEYRRAGELVRRKLRTVNSATDDAALFRRLVGTLSRRGYPQGVSFRVVREELQRHGREIDQVIDDSAEL